MKLENVLGPWVENVSQAPFKDQVLEILEAFGAGKDLGQLQIRACWEDFVDRPEFLVGCGLAFVETRMLGLLEPALIMACLRDGGHASGPTERVTRLILVYVGTPMPSPAERELLFRMKGVIKDKVVAERLCRAKSRLEVQEIFREVDRPLSASPAPAGRRTAKSCRAELLVSMCGDPLVEGRLRSAISKSGAAVEVVVSSRASNGGSEERLTISFDRGRSLDEIVHAAGSVEGVTVRTVSLFGPTLDPRPA